MQRESIDLYCASSFKEISRKHRTFSGDIDKAMTLLNQQLCPKKSPKPLTPKRLIHLHNGDGFEVWKYQVMVQRLRTNQWPRMWVGVAHKFDLLVPLVLDMHSNNYDDSEHQREAIQSMSSFYREMDTD